jgi:hypothetical protein
MMPLPSPRRLLLWAGLIVGSAAVFASVSASGHAEPQSSTVPSSSAAPVSAAAPSAAVPAASTVTAPARSGEPHTLLEQHWAPEVAKLQATLQELRGKATSTAERDALQRRIKELEQRVGEIQQHVASGSEQLAKLRASRSDRRDRALQALTTQWGAANLDAPAVRAELAQHARRSTRLKRVASVATEAGNAAAAKRARKLLDRENKRHSAAMAALLGTSPSASGQP